MCCRLSFSWTTEKEGRFQIQCRRFIALSAGSLRALLGWHSVPNCRMLTTTVSTPAETNHEREKKKQLDVTWDHLHGGRELQGMVFATEETRLWGGVSRH